MATVKRIEGREHSLRVTVETLETLAKEEPDLAHGVFTYALLQGLQGLADSDGDGQIEVDELGRFSTERVRQMTDGTQTPTSYIAAEKMFVLAR